MEEATVVEDGTVVAQLETVMEMGVREREARMATVTEEAVLAQVTSEGAMKVVGPAEGVTMVVVRAVGLKEAVCQAVVTPVEVKMVVATWVRVETAEVVGRVLALMVLAVLDGVTRVEVVRAEALKGMAAAAAMAQGMVVAAMVVE